jgi:hypothetical protein
LGQAARKPASLFVTGEVSEEEVVDAIEEVSAGAAAFVISTTKPSWAGAGRPLRRAFPEADVILFEAGQGRSVIFFADMSATPSAVA